MHDNIIKHLGGWEGYSVGAVQRFERGRKSKRPEVWIELFPDSESGVCDACGNIVDEVHDYSQRWVRDLPMFDADTWLLVHRRRLVCPKCGPKLEKLSWLSRYIRHTNRLVQSVAMLCNVMSIKHVASYFKLVDRVRVDEANRLRDDKPARKIIKGSRWLLLRNYENVDKPEDKVRLDELLQANESLMTVYVMKADLKHLWDFQCGDTTGHCTLHCLKG